MQASVVDVAEAVVDVIVEYIDVDIVKRFVLETAFRQDTSYRTVAKKQEIVYGQRTATTRTHSRTHVVNIIYSYPGTSPRQI